MKIFRNILVNECHSEEQGSRYETCEFDRLGEAGVWKKRVDCDIDPEVPQSVESHEKDE